MILAGRNRSKLEEVLEKCDNKDLHLLWCCDLATERDNIASSLMALLKFVGVAVAFAGGGGGAAGDGEAEEVDEDAAVADAGVLVDEGADAAALTEGLEGGAHGAVGEDDLQSRGPLAAAGNIISFVVYLKNNAAAPILPES